MALFPPTHRLLKQGDAKIDRTIQRLRDEDSAIVPRVRRKNGLFEKAATWAPTAFHPLTAKIIRDLTAIVDGVKLWHEIGNGTWYLQVGSEGGESTVEEDMLNTILQDHWRPLSEGLRQAVSKRQGGTGGNNPGPCSSTPTYKRIIMYNREGHMPVHCDNHHRIGAVSVILRVGSCDSSKGLFTCSHMDGKEKRFCKEKIGNAFAVPKGVCHGVRRTLRSSNRIVLVVGW